MTDLTPHVCWLSKSCEPVVSHTAPNSHGHYTTTLESPKTLSTNMEQFQSIVNRLAQHIQESATMEVD